MQIKRLKSETQMIPVIGFVYYVSFQKLSGIILCHFHNFKINPEIHFILFYFFRKGYISFGKNAKYHLGLIFELTKEDLG